jgi:hypothetical protein
MRYATEVTVPTSSAIYNCPPIALSNRQPMPTYVPSFGNVLGAGIQSLDPSFQNMSIQSHMLPIDVPSSSISANVSSTVTYPTLLSLRTISRAGSNLHSQNSGPYSQIGRGSGRRSTADPNEAGQTQAAGSQEIGGQMATTQSVDRLLSISKETAADFAIRCFINGPALLTRVKESKSFLQAMSLTQSITSPPRMFSSVLITPLLMRRSPPVSEAEIGSVTSEVRTHSGPILLLMISV